MRIVTGTRESAVASRVAAADARVTDPIARRPVAPRAVATPCRAAAPPLRDPEVLIDLILGAAPATLPLS